MKKTKCTQMKCSYNIMGGCQNCEVCDCTPNEINEDCDKCYNCANDEGILRWDNSTVKEKDTQKEKKKIEEKPLMVK